MTRDEVPGRAPEGMGGLAKGLAIIEAFGPGRTAMTVSEAARHASVTPAAARRCLITLRDLGYLHQVDRVFRPTPRLLRLGDSYLSSDALPMLAQPFVEAGRDELQEAVSLAVYDAGYALFVARASVERIVSLGVRVGARLPAYASATGRVLLSGLEDDHREAYLVDCRPEATSPRTLTDLDTIREQIARVDETGYALTDEELSIGMRTMAVPVRDATGRVVAAMSSSAFTANIGVEAMVTRHLPVLTAQAESLGRML